MLASDQDIKLENAVLCAVKKRTALGVHKERRCRASEIPWLLPWAAQLLPRAKQHGSKRPFPITQSAHTPVPDAHPKVAGLLQMYSNSFQLVLHKVSTYIPSVAVTLLSEEVHIPWPKRLSLPVMANVFLKWYENPQFHCSPHAGPGWNPLDTSRVWLGFL